MRIDDSVWRKKLRQRMTEAAYHHDRHAACPCYPCEAACHADEEISMLEQVDACLERQRSREILRTFRHTHDVLAVTDFPVAVYAQHAIPALLQRID